MKLWFLILFLWPFQLLATGQVTEIKNGQQVIADIFDTTKIHSRSKVIIISRETNKVIAFGTVSYLDDKVSPGMALITLDELTDQTLVILKDFVYPLDYELMREKKIPGFTSLTLQGDNSIPAQFKELAYFGVFTSEGHTMDKGEMLASPFQLQYGMTDNFGLKMVNALWLDGYVNAGVKFRPVRNKYAKITLNTLGAYKVQSQDYIWQAGGVITLPSNAKFQNHLMVNITLDPQFKEAHATKGLGLFQDSDIRNITEYITDNWNRILYGPVYNVELQTFGGTVSHMWIWDTFHMSLGIATKDFSNLTFGKNGYYYVYDLFWRF